MIATVWMMATMAGHANNYRRRAHLLGAIGLTICGIVLLPNFSFVVPNLLDDGHSGPLRLADSWLQDNIAPLISNATFQKEGLLVIVFDESATSDVAHGGGHVAAVIISSKARQGFQSTTLYQHQSALRLILEGLGVPTLPGSSGTAPEMAEFF